MFVALTSVASNSFAASPTKEFDEKTEIRCYKEAKALGCVQGSAEEDPQCVETKKAKLTKVCQKLHDLKK